MHVRSGSIVVAVSLCLAWLVGATAQAQTIHVSIDDIALRNGESIEFGDVFLVGSDCRSRLTAVPTVEIMDGPPGVAVAVKEAMVVPHGHGCGKSVRGGRVIITAREIDEYSYTRMVLRITYKTPNGNLQRSQHINVALFP
ncbi:MAG: hypothetical protein K2Y71_18670 [Xanthobacteraceae bacterium]|nr:hypothetical protein [Xanthobacteraceae bacterium]